MTSDDKFRYCEHVKYGVGSAIMTQFRYKPEQCLWMVSFQSLGFNEKYFFCTKHFYDGGDIKFIDEARADELYKQGQNKPKRKRSKIVQKDQKNLTDLLDSLF